MATDEIMVKPKGGRGKRADYNTVQVRCPEPIKSAVVNLINQWHLGEVQQSEPVTELTELQAEIEALKQANKNLNTTIEELRKRNKQLDNTLEINTLKAELTECKLNLNTSMETIEQLNLNTSKCVTEQSNPNTGINKAARDILEDALTLKANAGGKIKDAIRQALTLLK
ncbi:hypothetical protein PL8927_750078 [Planktothrix serta PCC 8927]|uniref:Uncharacterized protein n=1 Tax=Planktothrix serta PCC 8927 TaxID=671068 RepID=A0A7Z9BYM5_9CYAN|nr:hypothetical protein [Planktothrix serta]VXD22402.1 hypothetical protein PL8927_750078 [Planktothrix serta PCC 8927]